MSNQIYLAKIEGTARLSGICQDNCTWIQDEVSAEPLQCAECGAWIESGWTCLDGGGFVCDKHVTILTPTLIGDRLNDYAPLVEYDSSYGREPGWTITLACYGVYDNSCQVERANAQALAEKFKFMAQQHYGYGSCRTYIPVAELAEMTADEFVELMDVLDGLADYPCIDDELVYKLEMEAENEAWEDWLEHDIRAELNETALSDKELEISSDELFIAVQEAMNDTDTYFEHEAGGNVYLDIERILPTLIERLSDKAA